jgi:hypothetical protein
MVGYRSLPFGKEFLAVLGLAPVALNPVAVNPATLNPAGLVPLGMTAVAGLTAFGGVPAYAQSRDPIVTSDTPEYCGVLMDRITGVTRATTEPPPPEVTLLSEEGERMCVHGQTRGGILRLRRALAIIQHGED